MNQFGTILKFELKNYFKNKVFVGVTLFIVAVIAVVIFFPKIAASFESDSTDTSGESLPVMLIAADSEDEAQQIKEAFASAFEDYNIQVTAKGVEDIKAKITDEEAECGFYFESPVSYTYYVNDLSLYDENTTIADQVLQNVYRLNTMMQNGISAEKAGEILSAQISHNVENLGKNQMQNFFYTYIMIFHGNSSLRTIGCHKRCYGKKFKGNGAFDYQRQTYINDVRQSYGRLYCRIDSAYMYFRLCIFAFQY